MGYQPVVVDGENPSTGFAEAAHNLIDDGFFKWAQPTTSTTLTLVSNRGNEEMEALEAERLEKIADIDSALNHADDDSRPKLEALRKQLEAVKGGNADSIRSAIANATSTLSREGAGGGKAAGGNDPQERLDRAWEKIGELNKKIDTNFQKLDRYLTDEEKAERKKRDEEVEKRKAELERLKNSGASAEEILRAQQALRDAEKRRTEYDKTITDRIRNDPNTSPEDKKTADENARLLAQKLKELEEAQKAAMEVFKKTLRAAARDAKEVADALVEENKRMAKEREELARNRDIAKLGTTIAMYVGNGEGAAEPDNAVVSTNAEKKEPEKPAPGEQEKYAAADANPAEPVSPSTTPAQVASSKSSGRQDFD